MTTRKSNNIDISKVVKFTGKMIGNPYWYDSNSAWGAIKVSTEQDIPYSKKEIDYDVESNKSMEMYTVVVAGKMPQPENDNIYEFEGIPEFAQKFKRWQYKIISMVSIAPKTIEDCKTYLQSLCTEKQVEAMLSVYPNIVQDIIDGKDDYVDLSLLNGIGEAIWEKIKDKVISNFAIADVINLLVPLGISFNKLKKLLNDEPNPQILKEKLLKNPYVITEISGITFKTADKIATQLNTDFKDSEERLIAFVKYFLEEVGNSSGDTYISIEKIRDEVIENVPEVEKYLKEYIQKEIENPKFLHIEDDKIGLKYFYDSEKYVWDKLIEIDKSVPLEISEEKINEGIEQSELLQGFKFTEEQRKIIVEMTKNNFVSLSGLSGTGKTTLSRGILNVYSNAGYIINDRTYNYMVAVAALSAKAAIRAKEVTGFPATTIHRMLGAKGPNNFSYNEKYKLGYNVILCDESSMTNLFLFRKILEAVDTSKTKLLFVGDAGQIPSIGAGNIFFDILKQKNYKFSKFELTRIQRQAKGSAIITDGNFIRNGRDPLNGIREPRMIRGENKDLIYMFRSEKESLFSIAVSSYIKSVKEKGLENVVLLTPRKKDCLNSTKEFNKAIQNELNSENANIKFIHGDKEFRLNDKVIHLVNNYELNVMNGETGIVSEVNTKSFKVKYPDKEIEYTREIVNDLELAYSLSVHKTQGSEYEDVIIVIDNSHFMLLSNQLLYTAITRAKKRCLLLAEPYAFDKSLEENKTIRATWFNIIGKKEN